MRALSVGAVAGGLLAGLAFVVAGEALAPPPQRPLRCAGADDVLELVRRLKPLVKDPQAWREGVEIYFNADKSVRLTLEIDANNKYTGTAPTLREAVERVTSPSEEIKRAVEGW